MFLRLALKIRKKKAKRFDAFQTNESSKHLQIDKEPSVPLKKQDVAEGSIDNLKQSFGAGEIIY